MWHSLQDRSFALGLATSTVNGEMYFHCVSHDKCLNPNQVNALKRELMAETAARLYAHLDGRIVAELHRWGFQ